MVKYSERKVNNNGERLIELWETFQLKTMNGFFPHKIYTNIPVNNQRKTYDLLSTISSNQETKSSKQMTGGSIAAPNVDRTIIWWLQK